MMLVDSHCHLDAPEFDDDRAAVLARARAAGVMQQVVPAVARAEWPGLRAVCATDAGLFPAYGLHPMFLAEHQPEDLDALDEWIVRERPVAVGECGLDHFVDGLDHAAQARYFEGQLRLAHAHDLPVIVHARRAVDPVIAALKRFDGVRGVVHSFGGSAEQARQLWQRGFMIGLGGPLTYDRARRLHRVAATMPIEQLLLETDAPDQPDSRHRGQRNEPARLVHVVEAVARLRGELPEIVAAQTRDNAARLFGLPPL
ncbi:TatD family hydrolase [Luteimonas sp. S4-F44]|uniref:TatD family hydrolase n=1 Tax=Luteimonas sp. S4-F44 TaxID=2925842 RepID=UPI001F539A23|nr:TatD family hydrolase [Luteimonas sp. S4-F44]UNK44141.1 TatD family hydrolase [Luteimonas sp. S4-F44]